MCGKPRALTGLARPEGHLRDAGEKPVQCHTCYLIRLSKLRGEPAVDAVSQKTPAASLG